MTFVRWSNVSPTRERARPSSRMRAIVAWSTGSWAARGAERRTQRANGARRTEGRNDGTTERQKADDRQHPVASLRPCVIASSFRLSVRPSFRLTSLLIELPPRAQVVEVEDRVQDQGIAGHRL